MKVLVLSNFIKKEDEMIKILENKYGCPIFFLKDLSSNFYEFLKENPNWVLVGIPEESFDFISSNSTTIVYLENDFQVSQRRKMFLPVFRSLSSLKKSKKIYDSSFIREYFQKYSRKIIIIKTKKDYKKLLKALEKGMDL